MASEHSSSVTRSGHRVVSQFHSFITILDGVGATRPALGMGAVLMQHCS